MNNIYINEQVNVNAHTSREHEFSKDRLGGLSTDDDIYQVFCDNVDAIWAEFQKNTSIIQRSFTEEQFNQLLYSFFSITFDSYIYGDLARADGSHWKSSSHSMDYFIARHNLSHDTFVRFFDAVEHQGAYS